MGGGETTGESVASRLGLRILANDSNETEEQLDRRLGDNEANWRAAQAVPEAV